MVRVRKQVVRGDGLTERKFEIEELVYPVSQEEIDEYEAGQADFTGDFVWANLGPIVQAAELRLKELARDPPDDAFEPHVGEGWYCRQLIELGERIGRFADEWEVAWQALRDAVAFGELAAELRIRREHNASHKHTTMVRGRQSDAGRTSRRKRPINDDATIALWDKFFALSGKKTQADRETAAEVGVSERAIGQLRFRCGR